MPLDPVPDVVTVPPCIVTVMPEAVLLLLDWLRVNRPILLVVTLPLVIKMETSPGTQVGQEKSAAAIALRPGENPELTVLTVPPDMVIDTGPEPPDDATAPPLLPALIAPPVMTMLTAPAYSCVPCPVAICAYRPLLADVTVPPFIQIEAEPVLRLGGFGKKLI